MIKAVIFDMDGTLIDTESIWNKAWSEAEKKFSFKLDENVKKSFIGMPKQKMLEIKDTIIPSHLDYDEIQRFRVEYFNQYTSLHNLEVKKGAFNCLNYLKEKGIKAIVCTSTFEERAIPWLKKVELIEYFEDIITGDVVKIGKPNPEIYEIALSSNNLKPSECIAIEDTSVGVLAATGAKIKTYYIKDIIDINKEAASRMYKELKSLDEIIGEIGG